VFSKFKHLGVIVWQEGRISAVWWFLATALPAANEAIKKHLGHSVTELLPNWIPEPAWWWGAPILAAWVIFSLASRVLRYETPALELGVVRDERNNNSWWLEVSNVGSKVLGSCAVDFERIENTAGKRILPHSIGLLRGGNSSNPFPLRPQQSKQGRFAELENGKITLWGMSIDKVVTKMSLEDETYSVVVGAYSEAEGAQCKKIFTLSRKNGELNIS